MKNFFSLFLVTILILSMLSACSGSGSSISSTVTDTSTTVAPQNGEILNPKPTTEKPEEVIIADDAFITATFEKKYDAVNLGVTGVFYLDIKAQNKSDKEIWVYLDNASVNDEMVPMVMSGVPLNIQPEKTGRNGFIFSFSSLSIDKIEDVKKIEFDLVVADAETLSEMDRITSIKLVYA